MDGKSGAALEEAAQYWAGAGYPVVLTGAGISTESGVPDFRSSDGLWRRSPERLSSILALENEPEYFYPFYQDRIRNIWAAAPNAGHLGLAKLLRAGLLKTLITQNIDGFHQLAGADGVLELHGTLRMVRCLGCRAEFDSRRLLPRQFSGEIMPGYGSECDCPECGGRLRPDIVLFGEDLPQDVWRKAVNAANHADLFIVIGSSLTVGPANLLPEVAIDSGAAMLIINREATPLDARARWVIRESAGEAVSALTELLVKE